MHVPAEFLPAVFAVLAALYMLGRRLRRGVIRRQRDPGPPGYVIPPPQDVGEDTYGEGGAWTAPSLWVPPSAGHAGGVRGEDWIPGTPRLSPVIPTPYRTDPISDWHALIVNQIRPWVGPWEAMLRAWARLLVYTMEEDEKFLLGDAMTYIEVEREALERAGLWTWIGELNLLDRYTLLDFLNAHYAYRWRRRQLTRREREMAMPRSWRREVWHIAPLRGEDRIEPTAFPSERVADRLLEALRRHMAVCAMAPELHPRARLALHVWAAAAMRSEAVGSGPFPSPRLEARVRRAASGRADDFVFWLRTWMDAAGVSAEDLIHRARARGIWPRGKEGTLREDAPPVPVIANPARLLPRDGRAARLLPSDGEVVPVLISPSRRIRADIARAGARVDVEVVARQAFSLHAGPVLYLDIHLTVHPGGRRERYVLTLLPEEASRQALRTWEEGGGVSLEIRRWGRTFWRMVPGEEVLSALRQHARAYLEVVAAWEGPGLRFLSGGGDPTWRRLVDGAATFPAGGVGGGLVEGRDAPTGPAPVLLLPCPLPAGRILRQAALLGVTVWGSSIPMRVTVHLNVRREDDAPLCQGKLVASLEAQGAEQWLERCEEAKNLTVALVGEDGGAVLFAMGRGGPVREQVTATLRKALARARRR